jgi:hypothetical protein
MNAMYSCQIKEKERGIMGYYGNACIDNIEIPIGNQFESSLRSLFCSQCTKVNNKTCTAMDKYEGTDFIYMDMRVDATVYLSGKKWMPYIADTGIEVIPGQTLKIGIRHGNTYNGYTEFPEPVVVIGLDCADGKLFDLYEKEISQTLVHNADEIINTAVDVYADYQNGRKTPSFSYGDISPLSVKSSMDIDRKKFTLSIELDKHIQYNPNHEI